MARIFKKAGEFEHPFCPKMHYKPEVGIDSHNRTCWRCHQDRKIKKQRAKRRARKAHLPPFYQDATGFRQVRERLGLGRTDFARAIGVQYSMVRRWEDGEKAIRRDTVLRVVPIIADLLEEKRIENLRKEAEGKKYAA